MESQRSFMLIALALVSFLLWQEWQTAYGPKAVTPVEQTEQKASLTEAKFVASNVPSDLAQTGTNTNSVQNTAADVPANMANEPTVPVVRNQLGQSERFVEVTTDTLQVTIDLLGGDVVKANLIKYPITEGSNDAYSLLRPNAAALYVAQSGLIGANGPDANPDGRPLYTSPIMQYTLNNDSLSVPLSWVGSNGMRITKTFVFTRGNHAVELQQTITNGSNDTIIVQPYAQLKQTFTLPEGNMFMPTYRGAAYGTDLFFKIPLFKPDEWLGRTLKKVIFLGSKNFRKTVYILGALGLIFVIQQFEVFVKTFMYFFSFKGLLLYFLTLVFVKCLHELGHSYVAKYYGCRVSAIGIAFLVFFPFLYTDTTDAWRLRNHKERLLINFAGILTELHLALVATFVWGILPEGGLKSVAFFIATTSWISSLLINVSPFMRFDGYYVFSDWLKAENLQPRSFALAKWKMREILFGFNHPAPEEINPSRRLTCLLRVGAARGKDS